MKRNEDIRKNMLKGKRKELCGKTTNSEFVIFRKLQIQNSYIYL